MIKYAREGKSILDRWCYRDLNLRNYRESKDWGISEVLTSIFIFSQVYTRHTAFHSENLFFCIFFNLPLKENKCNFPKCVQELLKMKPF